MPSAMITGASRGLGEAIATDLAANGVRLAVIDIDREAVDRLRDQGHDAIVQGDPRHRPGGAVGD